MGKRWILCLCLLAATAWAQAPAKKQYTVEAMFAPAVTSSAPAALQWSPDGRKLAYLRAATADEQESLEYFDPATGRSASLIGSDSLATLVPSKSKLKDDRQRENRARYGVADYQWSPDSQSLLFDALGQLWLYDLTTKQGRQMTRAAAASRDPKFSPDGRYLSYVRDHNLFVRPVREGAELALTASSNAEVFNGEVDWLYAEELDVRSNYFWSPDSRQILYLETNEARVPHYPIVDWMSTHPEIDPERYPKAGDANPVVRLMLVDLEGKPQSVELPLAADDYIPRFGWARPNLAWAVVLNRRQTREQLYLIDTRTGRARCVLSEEDKNYLELHDAMGRGAHEGLRFLDRASQFLWLSWRDGFTHVYLYEFNPTVPLESDARLVRQLEHGSYEVANVLGVDEAKGAVYLEANQGDDRQEHLFAAPLAGGKLVQLTKQRGVHKVELSDDARYFVDTYSSLTWVPHMQICAVGGGCHEVWRSAARDGYDTLTPQFVDFSAEDGTVLRGVLLLPPNGVATERNGRVPLILNPYGGPHGQVVRDAASTIGVFDQIVAHRGFAVLKVDNRGMWNRGRAFAMPTFHRLGEIELRDQLTALDQVLERYPRLDPKRVGWWGWSYGGTMTGYALTHSTRFKAGISVAPVTDWHNYDSTYTERYMGLPTENVAGYERSSVVQAAAKLRGRLLLVHGTSDDNVHLQNSIQFIQAMIDAGRAFDLQLYPGKTHGIQGAAAGRHLYSRMLWHWEQYLAK